MADDTFRPEVYAARDSAALGSVRLVAPRSGWFALGVGGICGLALILIVAFGYYTRHERAKGVLVSKSGLAVVQNNAAATVSKVLVNTGDHVEAGQPLVELSTDQSTTADGDVRAAVVDELRRKLARYQADMGLIHDQDTTAHAVAEQKVSDLAAQVSLVTEQVEIQSQRTESSQKLYEQWHGLGDSGIVSRMQLLQQHDIALQNLAQLKDIRRQKLALETRLNDAKAALAKLPGDAQLQKNNVDRQIADATKAISEAEASRAVILRASVAGRVSNLMVHVGQALKLQTSLLVIVPDGATLEAELWLPARSVGFIRRGDPLVLRYDAFPSDRYGEWHGVVTEVALTAVVPAVDAAAASDAAREPRFRVRASLDRQDVRADGDVQPLRAGMSFTGDIIIGRRRLWQWIDGRS
jgi:membrane fusion protein